MKDCKFWSECKYVSSRWNLTLSREWHRNQSSCRQCSARWGCTCQRSSASEQTGLMVFLLLFVKLLLDVGCNVLLNVVLLQGLGGAVDSILRSKISFKIVSFTFNVLRSPPAASPRTCPHSWSLPSGQTSWCCRGRLKWGSAMVYRLSELTLSWL